MNRLGYLLAVAVLVGFGCGEAPKQDTPAATKPDTSPSAPSAAQSNALEQKAQLAAPQIPDKVDTDNDGVPDDLDQCADTRGQPVDDQGCPSRLQVAREFPLAISFASGSAEVDSALVMTALAEPLRIAESYPNAQVRVYAYTDSAGASAANQTLSQQRAEAVAEIVVSKGGVAASRVKAIGRGEADPVASNDMPAGRAANRRTVVVLLPGGAE
jgi:OOP family OmpA-OmpF porin